MLSKIFKLFLLLIILLPLFSNTEKAYAATCTFATEPTVLTREDTEFSVLVRGNLVGYAAYALEITYQGGGAENVDRIQFEFDSNPKKIYVNKPNGPPLGLMRFKIVPLGTLIPIFDNLQGVCEGQTYVGINPECRVIPQTGANKKEISFKVDGLNAGNEVRRGYEVVARDAALLYHKKGCASEAELKAGLDFLPSSNVTNGIYRVYVRQGCSIFTSPEGPPLCTGRDGRTQFVEFAVTEDGTFAIGSVCNPDRDNPETGKNRDCTTNSTKSERDSKRDIAPYCVKDKEGPMGTCGTLPGVKEKCKEDKNGNIECQTAIGAISANPDKFVANLLGVILGLSGGILLVFLILNGYKIMTSQGDPEKLKEARESITSAVVGILFIIFSIFILQLITRDILQIPGFQ